MILSGVVASQIPAAAAPGLGPHRYWRVVMSAHAGDNDNLLQLAELRLVDDVATEHTATFTASTTFSGGFPASNLADANTATSWAGAVAAIPATIFADLGSAMQIVGFKFTAADGPDGERNRAPSSWTIGWSDDAVTYTDVAQWEGIWEWDPASPRYFPFDFDLWRIRVSDNNGSATTTFMEVELRAALAGADQTTPAVDATTRDRIGGSVPNSGGHPVGAFDDSIAFTLAAAQVTNAMPNFLDYRFASPVSILQIAITSRVDGFNDQAPKDFKLQRSSDGISFTDIATFSGSTGWTPGLVRTFNV